MSNQLHSSEQLDALRQFSSPVISNAIEKFDVRDPVTGYADQRLRCQFPEYPPTVGYAVTCTADGTTPTESRPSRLYDLFDAVHDAPKPAILVVQHVGTDRLRSCFFGDMTTCGLQRLGVVALVTDGGGRDRSGIARRSPGFQLFSQGWVVSHGRPTFLDFQSNVSICGLNIAPGELLHGDECGLLTIPHDIVEPVIEEAQQVLKSEDAYFEYLESQEFSFEEWRRRVCQ